ncbi:glycosyltransferase [Paraburkholderia caballeronis]|uniref:glycosyltransferase n=1 Tax=Paraburkholderia caballeronis TaxID=416943 RepID=UPI0010D8B502|nr:glycosyl transferase family 1 [Paraburkholderia caballeronis]TDV21486.1 glycosyl transferase family 1 [Paraburkholderia caballeronis]TDV33525.1 glycosyl transferase family 1 [Paraburkholderia caballeronis]
MLMRDARPLRVLTWHVHGNYLYYLTQAPHDFYVVAKPGRPPGYAGRAGVLPWGANVHEVDASEVASREFDAIVYQHRSHWDADRHTLLSDAQRRLPRVYIEHDPPQEAPFAQRHWVDDRDTLLVHVTHFNQLMWDSGATPTRVIEHGVVVPDGVRYTGDVPRGIVVVNHLRERGRRLGADVFADLRERVPLDLVGMDAQSAGGIGEISNLALAAFTARYRFFFNPIRWTSLGLAIVEAMTIGMPIVGLATTELASVIRNGDNGIVDTRLDRLVDAMRVLIDDPTEARRLGDAARRTALERFHIDRFVYDWNDALRAVCA